ncbi:MAG: antibiotic biosynthesis monooxygenase [Spirochaetaceae bacterium]|jgi:quinol monooxygenase YgiN|nr:antibiotic biosynthesis monooxygenase [Spirochaetaceae bacterium]
MVHLVVTFGIKEGKMDEYLAELKKLRPLVLAEKGCVEYTFAREYKSSLAIQEPVDPNRLTLIEKWETPEALAIHGASSHMKEFEPRLKPLQTGVSARIMESAL